MPAQPAAVAEVRPNLLKTGAAQEAARVAAVQRQEQLRSKRRMPWRFRIDHKLPTEAERTKEFIILDSEIDQCPCFHEHQIRNNAPNAKGPDYEMCIREWTHCPLCEKYGESKYVQMISVIEFLRVPTRRGAWIAKKLLPVTLQQQNWFRTTCLETFGGNFRGAHIISTREADQRSPAIGTPRICIKDGMVVRYDEAQLHALLAHPEVRSEQNGQVIKRENEDLYPYNYAELFVTPTAEELRARYGGTIPAGSPAETAAAFAAQPTAVAPAAMQPPAAALPAPVVAAAPPAMATAPQPAPQQPVMPAAQVPVAPAQLATSQVATAPVQPAAPVVAPVQPAMPATAPAAPAPVATPPPPMDQSGLAGDQSLLDDDIPF
jgi:hypothetical protein